MGSIADVYFGPDGVSSELRSRYNVYGCTRRSFGAWGYCQGGPFAVLMEIEGGYPDNTNNPAPA